MTTQPVETYTFKPLEWHRIDTFERLGIDILADADDDPAELVQWWLKAYRILNKANQKEPAEFLAELGFTEDGEKWSITLSDETELSVTPATGRVWLRMGTHGMLLGEAKTFQDVTRLLAVLGISKD